MSDTSKKYNGKAAKQAADVELRKALQYGDLSPLPHMPDLAAILGKNSLGAEAWKAQGIDVGQVPPIPASITKALLESECPLHPCSKIKDTHLLVLVPAAVNEEPYSALKLDELCATRRGSGFRLMAGRHASWRRASWASTPQPTSEWVLLPKDDPDYTQVEDGKHFRTKPYAAQRKVHEEHYRDYREARSIELMTAVLLHDLTHKQRILPHARRCQEANASGGRVIIGNFLWSGLLVAADQGDDVCRGLGLALVRRV